MDQLNSNTFFDKINLSYVNKNVTIDNILNEVSKTFVDLPISIINNAKEYYHQDQRSLGEIVEELHNQITRLFEMEKLVNKEIPTDVLENSYLFIGPMGVGKSTAASTLAKEKNLDLISLDNREQLSNLYKLSDKIKDFKDFEFYLTSSVLTGLQRPSVVDFGAGHSVYESPIMFYEMSKLIKKFNNVIYLIPSESKEESISLLEERIKLRNPGNIDKKLNDNKHFINMPCNENLATTTIYTNNKNVNEINNEILSRVNNRNLKRDQGGFVDYIIISLLVGFVIGVVAALSYVFIRG